MRVEEVLLTSSDVNLARYYRYHPVPPSMTNVGKLFLHVERLQDWIERGDYP